MPKKGDRKPDVMNVKNGYAVWAKSYDQDLSYLDSFEKENFWAILGKVKGKKVLDAGCGTGRLVPELVQMGADITCLDVSAEMLEVLRRKYPKIKTVNADVCRMPFEDDCFDVVIASFLIVHLRDLSPAFREIYRVLKPGGSFVLTNINQRKAPKLSLKTGGAIVIKSQYHMPKHVIKALKEDLFTIEEEEFVYEGDMWVNQIIKAVK